MDLNLKRLLVLFKLRKIKLSNQMPGSNRHIREMPECVFTCLQILKPIMKKWAQNPAQMKA